MWERREGYLHFVLFFDVVKQVREENFVVFIFYAIYFDFGALGFSVDYKMVKADIGNSLRALALAVPGPMLYSVRCNLLRLTPHNFSLTTNAAAPERGDTFFEPDNYEKITITATAQNDGVSAKAWEASKYGRSGLVNVTLRKESTDNYVLTDADLADEPVRLDGTPYFGALGTWVAFEYLERDKVTRIPPVYLGSFSSSVRGHNYDVAEDTFLYEESPAYSALEDAKASFVPIDRCKRVSWPGEYWQRVKEAEYPVVAYNLMGTLGKDGRAILFRTSRTILVPCPGDVLDAGDCFYMPDWRFWDKSAACAKMWLEGAQDDGAAMKGWKTRAHYEWGANYPVDEIPDCERLPLARWWATKNQLLVRRSFRSCEVKNEENRVVYTCSDAWERAQKWTDMIFVSGDRATAFVLVNKIKESGCFYYTGQPSKVSYATFEIMYRIERLRGSKDPEADVALKDKYLLYEGTRTTADNYNYTLYMIANKTKAVRELPKMEWQELGPDPATPVRSSGGGFW